jgi:hypothetical protein
VTPFALTRRPWLLLLIVLPGTAAFFGVQFDVAWHIDYGRDHFSIPPHLVILAGVQLGGLALAALLAWTTTLARRGAPVLTPMTRWRGIPLSPLLVVALACFVAPGVVIALDEGWHRIFGLDVSAWSPTHLTALYTAATTGLATTAFLAAELNRRYPDRASGALRRLRDLNPSELWLVYTLGLFGAGLLVMLVEYDFDVPQFNLAFEPPLLAAISAFPVFAGMAALGVRFGATLVGGAVVAFKLATVLGIVVLGRTHPDVPTSIVLGALAADVVVLAAGRRRAAVVGALAAYPLVLLAGEWLRLELLDQPQWTDGLWPLGAPLAIPAAMAAGALGLRAGWALRPVAEPAPAPAPSVRRLARRLVPTGLIVLLVLGPAVPAALGAIYTRDVVLSRIEISPARPAPGDSVRVRVVVGEHSISGDRPPFLDSPRRELGAFRAEERLRAPLRRIGPRTFEGRLTLDRPGKWILWPRFKLPDKRWIDRVELKLLPGARGGGTHAEQIALGPEADPDNAPTWLKPFGFAVMLAIWSAVTLAVVRALRVVARFGFEETRA